MGGDSGEDEGEVEQSGAATVVDALSICAKATEMCRYAALPSASESAKHTLTGSTFTSALPPAAMPAKPAVRSPAHGAYR